MSTYMGVNIFIDAPSDSHTLVLYTIWFCRDLDGTALLAGAASPNCDVVTAALSIWNKKYTCIIMPQKSYIYLTLVVPNPLVTTLMRVARIFLRVARIIASTAGYVSKSSWFFNNCFLSHLKSIEIHCVNNINLYKWFTIS